METKFTPGDQVIYNKNKDINKKRPFKWLKEETIYTVKETNPKGRLILTKGNLNNPRIKGSYSPKIFDKIIQKQKAPKNPPLDVPKKPTIIKNKYYFFKTFQDIYKIVYWNNKDLVIEGLSGQLHALPKDAFETNAREISKSEYVMLKVLRILDKYKEEIPADLKHDINRLATSVLQTPNKEKDNE